MLGPHSSHTAALWHFITRWIAKLHALAPSLFPSHFYFLCLAQRRIHPIVHPTLYPPPSSKSRYCLFWRAEGRGPVPTCSTKPTQFGAGGRSTAYKAPECATGTKLIYNTMIMWAMDMIKPLHNKQ